MEKRIERMQSCLSSAHKAIQDLVLQATAGNASNVVSSLNNIQFVFNELQAIKNELKDKDQKEKADG
jgi:hypothetical protein